MAALAVALSALALAARGVDSWSVAVVASGGAVGMLTPLRASDRGSALRWCAIAGTGTAAFVSTSAWWSAPVSATRWMVLASLAAAVAEELLFRRAMYGLLERWGSLGAVGTTAMAFALVHVPAYGWRALPLDAAAGLVFGWQRWASGSWTAPAVTHAIANVAVYA